MALCLGLVLEAGAPCTEKETPIVMFKLHSIESDRMSTKFIVVIFYFVLSECRLAISSPSDLFNSKHLTALKAVCADMSEH